MVVMPFLWALHWSLQQLDVCQCGHCCRKSEPKISVNIQEPPKFLTWTAGVEGFRGRKEHMNFLSSSSLFFLVLLDKLINMFGWMSGIKSLDANWSRVSPAASALLLCEYRPEPWVCVAFTCTWKLLTDGQKCSGVLTVRSSGAACFI